jgi:1-acyl-sn-glycerol-3-phosphate acyltransferase
VDQAGTAPQTGPVLFLANHPNALLDPAIIWTTAGRDVRFLAKSTLFEGLFRPFLIGAGAIPVYRRKDEGVDTSRNAEMFAAVDAALRGGAAVCIFPEGVSHSQGRLLALRTGAARIAMAAEASGTRVALVAVGLNFDRKTRFRSRVTAVYGPAFYAPDAASDHDAVRTLTDRIAVHMRQLLVEADPGADARLVDRIDRLYSAARGRPRQAEERIARRQAIAGGIERMRANDPERYEQLLLRVRRYDARLRRFGLRDRHLDMDVSTGAAVAFALREAFLAVPLAPAALGGLIVFFVPYWLTAIAARIATREPDVAASAKVIAGAIIYVAWIAVAAGLAWTWKGPIAAAIATIGLPVIAVASLFAVERESAVIDAIRAWVAIRRVRFGVGILRRRRSELADVLNEAYEWVTSRASDPMASVRS